MTNRYEGKCHYCKCTAGKNGYYRIGFLLGFFSSYELHEIPYSDEIYGVPVRDEVDRYRSEFKTWL